MLLHKMGSSLVLSRSDNVSVFQNEVGDSQHEIGDGQARGQEVGRVLPEVRVVDEEQDHDAVQDPADDAKNKDDVGPEF